MPGTDARTLLHIVSTRHRGAWIVPEIAEHLDT
jgi:hypothetical protein